MWYTEMQLRKHTEEKSNDMEKIYFAGKIFAVSAAVLVIICIFLWFRFSIKDVYDELSGKSSRRAVEEYRRKTGGIKCAEIKNEKESRGAEVTGVMDLRKSQKEVGL